MKNTREYEHKKVLVLGLAKSGVSAALLLHKLDAFVTVNDVKPLKENPEAMGLLEEGIKVICGGHPIELLDEGFELIIKNPGIPYTNPIIEGALERNIPIITEVELAYQISLAPMIGITGTNGKTTTTTLIDLILAESNQNPLIAGNIGTVASEVAQVATEENVMVVELSSFQLMGINTFRPQIAVLTNLYEAHIDYHGSKTLYALAKKRITENQTPSDYLVYNYDQVEVRELIEDSKAHKVPFSLYEKVEGAYVYDGSIYFKEEQIIDLNKVALPGKHNLENILASVASTKLHGAENSAIVSVLTSFSGVKHRTQFVTEKDGRRFYNDSKATNILACKSALGAFEEPTILLAGGLDRGNGFDELIPSLKNVKGLVVFGQTADKWRQTGEKAGIDWIVSVENVESAVPVAYENSLPGDVILLSPACASWDQYKTFEVRGDMFIEAVHKL
ncbi:UDP-N-acetylmuramoyl-L-alanyl-D-glutamate synthetase [Bacillus coahuilensis m2-6]|uniref:UDP-N-acetylmuramoyl-L-alanine--D-glutamate ligase n=1 Tax=Bacillus coahuilensis TaxID=408580 RepID=UPI0007500F6C|nr:UDP-N-acetylmuramoyl-L-alanine--D-glutamate ligase [Bacillus coahuilensis]KUP08573.1 UDP-N-acetylmuramoyl-L-alanyl-D-glutamate synthetase [Bacillus coahuilensis m2-6]